jgi:hypothetical protein
VAHLQNLLDRTKENHRNISQDSWTPGQESITGSSEYEEALTTNGNIQHVTHMHKA